ncbi:energy transducer TonB [Sphingomonas sp. T9W2]|uniref:energy transducer TonB n=1 Tax=Sphingomonas sp. T9W2 TaxID=3143183 RepID=UPI0031F54A60
MIDAILHGLLAVAQAATPAPAAATLQAQFDAANIAYETRKCADAIRLYDALEARTVGTKNALLLGAVKVRKGICVARSGDHVAGAALIRQGMPALARQATEFGADLRDAHMVLGTAAFDAFDYDAAASSYRDALALAKGPDRIAPLLALSRTLAFDGDGKALAYAQEARDLAAREPAIGKDVLALIQTRHARVLLNNGKKEEAYSVLKDSLRKQGGLDQRVSSSEVATRADLALAALLNGDRQQAQTYMAYTGAGRMKDDAFAAAINMKSAACGSATGLKPDDFAVVEFSVADNGTVNAVTPIYTTGGRDVVLAFARAVSDWSWSPTESVKIPAFFRNATRIELKCSTAADRPSLVQPLSDAFDAWVRGKGHQQDWSDLTPARAYPLVRAEATRARAAGDQGALLAADAWIAYSSLPTEAERIAAAAEAVALARTMQAPAPVITYLALAEIDADRSHYDQDVRKRTALLARPEINADPLSAATVRMMLANRSYPAAPKAEAEQLIAAVVAAPLPENHPLKVAALLRQADLLAQRGEVAQARAAFDRTGLTSDQCALIAPSPVVQRSGATSSLYPTEAVQMGFQGWAQVEFDIAADGRTVTQRTIAAYPPFVFGEAAQKMVGATRYRSSFRPEGNTACSANIQRFRFQL